MKNPKIRIFVRGGMVNNVYSSTPSVEVELIDMDVMEYDGDTEDADALLAECEESDKWHDLPL